MRSRGAAPLAVALFGAVFLNDAISGAQYAGVALLACGIALMARGVDVPDKLQAIMRASNLERLLPAPANLTDIAQISKKGVTI